MLSFVSLPKQTNFTSGLVFNFTSTRRQEAPVKDEIRQESESERGNEKKGRKRATAKKENYESVTCGDVWRSLHIRRNVNKQREEKQIGWGNVKSFEIEQISCPLNVAAGLNAGHSFSPSPEERLGEQLRAVVELPDVGLFLPSH